MAGLAVFCIVFLGHALSPVTQSCDSRYFLHVASSVARHGTLQLDEYRAALRVPGLEYGLRFRDGHIYSAYPVALPVLIAPVVRLLDFASGGKIDTMLRHSASTRLEIGIAAAIVAAASTVLFRVLRHWLSQAASLGVALVFGFGTSAWSVASRALWPHGMTMLLVSLALLCIVNERRAHWAGFFLGLACAVRPTNLLSLAAIAAYLLVHAPRRIPAYLALALLAVLPFAAITYATFGSLLPPQYSANESSLGLHHAYFEALAANLVSPSRGLLVFSPVTLISIAGAVMWIRQRELFGIVLAAVAVTHWLILSSWSVWWCGWSFGPRYLADIMPYLAVLSVPAVQRMRTAALPLRAAVTALVLASVLINERGAFRTSTWLWNATPIDVDDAPERVWDWHDPQFAR